MTPQKPGPEIIAESIRFFSAPEDDPLITLEKAQTTLLSLCDLLEQIADSIPGEISGDTCGKVGIHMPPLIRNIHQFEEGVFHPLAVKRFGSTPAIESTLERLRHEHCEDACFAEELSDTLRELSTGRAPDNPEATGYMLRGFFEALRRHIAFEREYLLGFMLRSAANGSNRFLMG